MTSNETSLFSSRINEVEMVSSYSNSIITITITFCIENNYKSHHILFLRRTHERLCSKLSVTLLTETENSNNIKLKRERETFKLISTLYTNKNIIT